MPAKKKVAYPITWDGFVAAAKDAGTRYPELVAAQAVLESGWFMLCSGQNNYFGLKGKTGEGKLLSTYEVINGKEVELDDWFLDFGSMQECVQYLCTRWYRDFESYEGIDRAPTIKDAAHELVAQGYCTDPTYADKLCKILKEHGVPLDGVKAVKAVKAKPLPLLFTAVALQDTWLKVDLKQASELDDDHKVFCAKGAGIGVVGFREIAQDSHALVELAGNPRQLYLYEPHWKRESLGSKASEIDWSDFGCMVTPNLSVGEILQYDARRIPGPNAAVRTRLVRTAQQFQAIRDAWGRPLGVTSFYRPEPINSQVGGVRGSRHVTGEAFDVYPMDKPLETFYRWIVTRWSGALGDGRHRGFIHLDTRNGGCFVPSSGARPCATWTY